MISETERKLTDPIAILLSISTRQAFEVLAPVVTRCLDLLDIMLQHHRIPLRL